MSCPWMVKPCCAGSSPPINGWMRIVGPDSTSAEPSSGALAYSNVSAAATNASPKTVAGVCAWCGVAHAHHVAWIEAFHRSVPTAKASRSGPCWGRPDMDAAVTALPLGAPGVCAVASRSTLETTSAVVGVNLGDDPRCELDDPRCELDPAGPTAGSVGAARKLTEFNSSRVLRGRRISRRSSRTWFTCCHACILEAGGRRGPCLIARRGCRRAHRRHITSPGLLLDAQRAPGRRGRVVDLHDVRRGGTRLACRDSAVASAGTTFSVFSGASGPSSGPSSRTSSSQLPAFRDDAFRRFRIEVLASCACCLAGGTVDRQACVPPRPGPPREPP